MTQKQIEKALEKQTLQSYTPVLSAIGFRKLMTHVQYIEPIGDAMKPYRLKFAGVVKFFNDTGEVIPFVESKMKIKVIR